MTAARRGELAVRVAGAAEAEAIAVLLRDFNREFGEPAPATDVLAERVRLLLDSGDSTVLLGGKRPDGLAFLRFRPALWTKGREGYLAELYVAPECRGRGLGRALLEAAIDHCRNHGTDRLELGTSENDIAARSLYESLGFTNREGRGEGPLMYVYGLEL